MPTDPRTQCYCKTFPTQDEAENEAGNWRRASNPGHAYAADVTPVDDSWHLRVCFPITSDQGMNFPSSDGWVHCAADATNDD